MSAEQFGGDGVPGRYWPTAKAARACGITVPADVDDDEAVVFVAEVSS